MGRIIPHNPWDGAGLALAKGERPATVGGPYKGKKNQEPSQEWLGHKKMAPAPQRRPGSKKRTPESGRYNGGSRGHG
jgi:hypothetical protein